MLLLCFSFCLDVLVFSLSERNCIEIVTKLVQEKKLDVVHTLDGKEYITPAQIVREIHDELYTHGGRINIVELQKLINVDLVHVESRAIEVSKQDRGTHLILGQLIDEKYLDQLAEEVNDKLQEVGQVNTAELCKTYDLPGDFLTQELCGRVGRIIDGQVDEFNRGVIFTQAFICRQTARIRGVFSALTRPTPVSALISVFGFHENLLYSVLEELVNSGRLKGTVVGGRQDKAVYIPEIYSRTQNAWVDSFLKQNGYLEFEALTRLGIPDPVSYIKKRLKSSKLLFLRSACVGPEIIAQLEASVEEAISSQTWVDLQVHFKLLIINHLLFQTSKIMQRKQIHIHKILSSEINIWWNNPDCVNLTSSVFVCFRQALLLHKQALLEQLNVAEDPALILHLTSVLLFQNLMHCMLHAPGRCVPNIIGTLQPKLSEDQYKLLVQYQGLVVKRLVQSHSQEKKADGAEQGGEDSSAELESVLKELNSLSGTIKELVLNPRKPSTTED
uniref:E3 UFM1-protein ligase 1 n=1 Tax=Astyanax mexicanus TaxID=7994 RepID=A0A8B9J8P8_ASTMX